MPDSNGAIPSLDGVAFGIEGDTTALKLARQIVRSLGGVTFSIKKQNKAAYHAWGGFSSPLLVALLMTGEEVARAAGISVTDARKKMMPIVRQTLGNYEKFGPEEAFTGPLVRGDADVVRKHLALLRKLPDAREVYLALARSALDNISIGIDSVDPKERSKPLSPVGVDGARLLERFVAPLAEAWTGRFIKLDVVFYGDKRRTLDVIRAGRGLGINVSVVELNGVMANVTDQEMRNLFLELIAETAAEFSLEAKLDKPLNEIYLFDRTEQTPIKFYQDHCRDRDCGHCRKLHLRVSPTGNGWGAVPCFLQAQSRIIPLAVDGRMSAERFEDAIRYNGRGPSWFAGTPYESLS